MMEKNSNPLQRDRIHKPMAAESAPYLQRRKNNCSMMAVHIMVLQRGKIYRRMMAADGLTCHAHKTIFSQALLCIKNGMLLLRLNNNMPLFYL